MRDGHYSVPSDTFLSVLPPTLEHMLVGRIRSTETHTVTVQADSLEAVQAELAAQAPAGFELVKSPVAMRKGSTVLDAVGTFERRDQMRDIEADDMAALEAKVPEGWKLIAVRSL